MSAAASEPASTTRPAGRASATAADQPGAAPRPAAARPARRARPGPADDPLREAMRAGLLLGWLSVAAVLVAVALDVPTRHPVAIVALALAAAVANGATALLPWRRLLGAGYRRTLLDLWAVGLLVFVAALIVVGGAQARFDLLLFLVLPFIAVTHEGRRLTAWLVASAATLAASMALAPESLSLAEVALHAVLLSASVLLALSLARASRESAAAAARASAAAELEQALLAESHHRIKNSLQTVADLLLLGRPEDAGGAAAFDSTAARIRGIAAVHHLLAGRRGGTVESEELLRTVVAASAAPGDEVVVVSDPLRLEAARAQQLAVIANELVANALRHGRPPVTVVLAVEGEGAARLEVRDAGRLAEPAPAPPAGSGLGLTLVRQIARAGLGGDFDLRPQPDGTTIAVLRFNLTPDADPDR